MFLITRATVIATVTVQASFRVLVHLSEFCCSSVSLLRANLVVCASHSQRRIRRPDSDSSSTRNSEFDGMECDSKARGRAPSAYRDWCPSLLGLNTSCQQQYKQRPAYRDWCPALPGLVGPAAISAQGPRPSRPSRPAAGRRPAGSRAEPAIDSVSAIKGRATRLARAGGAGSVGHGGEPAAGGCAGPA